MYPALKSLRLDRYSFGGGWYDEELEDEKGTDGSTPFAASYMSQHYGCRGSLATVAMNPYESRVYGSSR
jgi:hypothetical protein